ncbi:hypothetical protein C2869_11475 [Saccharobesus litoralis]|uniref:Uncharacterized protein n=1 Tax=Saccharobesus litoralis TaxID=2172099 RepID=A0A2S0VSE1_9ALTE|nr:tyrosine-protein kinase family protein [Saccharobesus litoralis]AWB67020.1 hypothetical protein C2869_11475 [Saccharobesus litoralis]
MSLNAQPTTQAEDEIDLGELLAFLWSKKWFILIITSIAVVAALLVVKRLPNIYQAKASVMVQGQKSQNPLAGMIPELTGGSNDQMDTIIKVIKSQQFANELFYLIDVTQFNLTDPNWTPTALQNGISVNTTKKSNILEVKFEHASPALTKKVVDLVVDNLTGFQQRMLKPTSQENSAWLNKKIDEITREIETYENQMAEMREQHGIIDLAGYAKQLKTELEQLIGEDRKLTKEKTKLNSLLEQIELAKQTPSLISGNHNLAASAVLKKLVDTLAIQKAELAQIQLRYLHKHPKHQSIIKRIQETESQLKVAVKNLEMRYISRLEEIQDLILENSASQRKVNRELEETIYLGAEQTKLQKLIEKDMQLLESIAKKKTEMELIQDMDHTKSIIIIDPASLPEHPIKPKKKLIIVMAGMLGMIIAIAISLVLRIFTDSHVRHRQTIISNGYKVLGELPKLRISRKKKHLPILTGAGNQFEIYKESIHAIRTRFSLFPELSHTKILAISSLMPNEGKSTTCLHLAKSFGELERVVIIDADLRAPSIAETLQQPLGRPGLTNLLAQTHSFKECKFYDERLGADVITCGRKPRNPLLFFSHKRFAKLLEVLQTKYDRIILECPPILSVSDALLISKYVDGINLVTDVTQNTPAKLNHDLQLLKHSGTKVNGVILNRIKSESSKRYYGVPSVPQGNLKRA